MSDSGHPLQMTSRTFYLALTVIMIAMVVIASVFIVRMARHPSEQIEKMLFEQDYVSARTEIEKRLLAGGNRGEAYYFLGRIELALDHPKEAIDAIEKSEKSGFSGSSLEVIRALVMARAGNYQQAEAILLPAFENGGSPKAEIREGLSRIYLGQFKMARASQAIEAWKQVSPHDDRPYLLRSEIDARTGADSDVMIRDFEAALLRNPQNMIAHKKLAQTLLSQNRLDESLNHFQICLKANPQDASILIGLGQVALKRSDQDEAEGYLREALKINPEEVFALSELSQIEIEKGNIQGALGQLEQALKVSPFNSELLYKYSQALKLAGNLDRSKKVLQQSNQLKVEEKQIEEIRKELVRNPSNLEIRVEAAEWLISHGHEREGLEWADQVLKQKPAHQSMCKFLAQFYLKKNDHALSNYYASLVLPVNKSGH